MSRGKAKMKDLKDPVQRPGRHPCLCESSKHELVGNCLKCGRIVCTQEGVGPCLTCGNYVYSMEQRQERMNMLQAERLKQDWESQQRQEKTGSCGGLRDIAASFEKAVNLKNKLLDYDHSSKSMTKVIDDEADYFQMASEHWLSNETRKEVQKQADHIHANKNVKSKKLLLDFSAKTISEFEVPVIPDVDAARAALEEKTQLKSDYQIVDTKSLENPLLPKLRYLNTEEGSNKKAAKASNSSAVKEEIFGNMKLQDGALMEMSDEGVCLTIQQPWASLLLHGIKLHEGRNWYTPYRGRLWIHSGAKEPSADDIARAENLFKLMHESIQLPKSYPTGYLLGYAYLKDCLPSEEYTERYPSGYVDSPYVFIFEEPVQLKVKMPMNGKGKLYKLDQQVFRAAAKQAAS